jgi:hypothetical protein
MSSSLDAIKSFLVLIKLALVVGANLATMFFQANPASPLGISSDLLE